MPQESPQSLENQACVYALKLLAHTPRSRQVISERLARKGFEPSVAEAALQRLERLGAINDRAVADSILFRYGSARPSGRRRIEFEMKKRGIPAEISKAALENFSGQLELEGACELASRRVERMKHLNPQKRQKKIYDFLLRRGFSLSVAREAMAAAAVRLEAEDEEINEDR